MSADSSTLKIDNQKNGWHGVCINHEHNGDEIFSPVRGLGRRYLHLRHHGGPNYQSLPLSTVFQDGKKRNVTDKEIRAARKSAAAQLDYPSRGIPIERVRIPIRCDVEGQMPSPSRGTQIGTSKNWEDGGGKPSRSTSRSNYAASQKACRGA
jgi:hypothetical protein